MSCPSAISAGRTLSEAVGTCGSERCQPLRNSKTACRRPPAPRASGVVKSRVCVTMPVPCAYRTAYIVLDIACCKNMRAPLVHVGLWTFHFRAVYLTRLAPRGPPMGARAGRSSHERLSESRAPAAPRRALSLFRLELAHAPAPLRLTTLATPGLPLPPKSPSTGPYRHTIQGQSVWCAARVTRRVRWHRGGGNARATLGRAARGKYAKSRRRRTGTRPVAARAAAARAAQTWPSLVHAGR